MNVTYYPIITDRADMTHEAMPVRALPAHGFSRDPIRTPLKELLCTLDVSYKWAREETLHRSTRFSHFDMNIGEYII